MPNSTPNVITFEDEVSNILHCWMHRIHDCLDKHEVPHFQRVLAAHHLEMGQLGKSTKLSMPQWDLFTSTLKADIPDIVLRFLSTAQLSDLGIYGYAIASCNTLEEALELSNNLHFLTADRQTQKMRIAGNKSILYPEQLLPVTDYADIAEDTLAGSWRLLKLLLGAQFDPQPVTVNFSYPAPAHLGSYEKTFDKRCYFEQSETAIIFPSKWLNTPVVPATKTSNAITGDFIPGVLGSKSLEKHNAVDTVKRLLLSRLNRRMPSLDEAAAELHLNTSRLRQQLYRVSTSYKKVVLDVRMTLARHYLERTDFDIQDIAFLLDYSEAAAFSRSFKKYYGISPLPWRSQAA